MLNKGRLENYTILIIYLLLGIGRLWIIYMLTALRI